MIRSDNECYVSENKGFADFDLAINSPNTQPAGEGENSDLSASPRICAVCPVLLRGRQRRCCSGECQRAYARSFTHGRDQRGEKNANFRGWRSRNPVLYTREYKVRNPEKTNAHRLLSSALASGEIVRPKFCDSCFCDCRPDGHHDDYSQPLSVQWLCRKCHIARHRILKLAQRLETLPEYERWRHERQLSLGGAMSGSPNTVERRGREC